MIATTQGVIVRNLVSDVSLTMRNMRRAPAFPAIIILTLGLALGANATMFGVVDRLLFRAPPHIVNPDRVTRIHVSRFFVSSLRPPAAALSYPAFTDLRDRTRVFSAVAAFDETQVAFGLGAEGRQLEAVKTTGQYFPLFGARPALGRFYGEEEARLPVGEPVAVLGNGLWRTAFGADSTVLGRSVLLDGRPFRVIGVAPAGFTGTQLGRVDVWFPLTAHAELDSTGFPGWATSRGWQTFRVIARVRDGVTDEQAASDVLRAYREGHADFQEYERRAETRLLSLMSRDPSTGNRQARVSAWLLGMAAIVLVIACANVANLMLARGLARRGEVAMRRALGGSTGRLVRQFATESMLLVTLGCVVGLAIAQLGANIVRAVLFPGTTWDAPPLDHRVLAATAGAAILAALVAGVLPLLRGSRSELTSAMHGVARGSVGHPRRLLAALLVVQTGLTMVLLIAAGLFVASLSRVQSLDLGFDAQRLLHVDASLSRTGASPQEVSTFYRDAADRLRNVPGVTHAGLAIGAPFMSNYATGLRVPGMDTIPRQPGGGPYYFRVGAGTLEALGVRLLRGRFISADDDRVGAAPVTVVTDNMARTLWPGKNPLAQCLIISRRPCANVVGVVADLHRQQLREPAFFLYFVPLSFTPGQAPEVLIVRTAGPPGAMVEVIRRELLAMRNDLPYVHIEPYEALIAPQGRSWQLGATMFTVFGILSLLIALVGVYGVLSFSVTQRMPELGVRAALGATPFDVLRMIVAGGLGTALTGVLLGGIAALGLSRRIEPLLFETSAREPMMYVAAALVIAAGALVASMVPGMRAARADPVTALRSD
ncbi:MAG: ADOP family duplicated permease [Gemmatimonadaceae bacterium]